MRPDYETALGCTNEAPSAGIGTVSLVGAGPGDPDLLTIKALKAIEAADVIFHDRLVSSEILALAPPGSRLIPVGKSRANHSVPQDDIHALMIDAALNGLCVVRLKGGDPFIFGRGGEEMEAVRNAGVPVTIVPGISSALGCAASAGIPLTHRDHAQSVTFVTGHARTGGVPDLDWAALANPHQTAVVFMGVNTARPIANALIEAGRSIDTPVAVVENGTRSSQIAVRATLATLGDQIADAGITGPALVIIGEVVALSSLLETKAPADTVTNQAFADTLEGSLV